MATNQTFVDYQTPIPADWLNNVNNKVNILANKGTNIASAAAINLGAATGDYVVITGTTTITSFGTADAGTERTLVFSGVLTLTHNATSLILPGGVDIVTDVGDIATFRSESSGNWRCTGYQPNINGLKSTLPLSFSVAGNERLRIDTLGQVLVGQNQTSQFPVPALQATDSWHATSRRASIGIGSAWVLLQDSDGTGTKDFTLYNTVSARQRMQFDVTGNSTHTDPNGGLGYGPGAGGTVTQSTSKSTAVTLNKPCGQITMNNAALAAGAEVGFVVNNTLVGLGDSILISPSWVTVNPGNYQCRLTYVGGGNFGISVKNISAGSLSEALQINFAIIKGATS